MQHPQWDAEVHLIPDSSAFQLWMALAVLFHDKQPPQPKQFRNPRTPLWVVGGGVTPPPVGGEVAPSLTFLCSPDPGWTRRSWRSLSFGPSPVSPGRPFCPPVLRSHLHRLEFFFLCCIQIFLCLFFQGQ